MSITSQDHISLQLVISCKVYTTGNVEKSDFQTEHGHFSSIQSPRGFKTLVDTESQLWSLDKMLSRDMAGSCLIAYSEDEIVFKRAEKDHIQYVRLISGK